MVAQRDEESIALAAAFGQLWCLAHWRDTPKEERKAATERLVKKAWADPRVRFRAAQRRERLSFALDYCTPPAVCCWGNRMPSDSLPSSGNGPGDSPCETGKSG